MKILGISELDNDAGACALIDGKVAAAANEERFSRIKQHAGFPFRAVEWICKHTGVEPKDFDAIAIAKPEAEEEIRLVRKPVLEYGWNQERRSSFLDKKLTQAAFRFYRFPKHKRSVLDLNAELETWLRQSDIDRSKIYRVDHHRAHALSAQVASGFDACLAVTCDGQGAGVTGTVWKGEGISLHPIQKIHLPHSMGNFYAAATKALGFTPNRHEGKVTGLAAYAEPTEEDLATLRRIAWAGGGSYYAPCVYGAYPKIKRFLDNAGKERFAATFQKVLEETVVDWVRFHADQTGLSRVVLSGGVFANVKLNQRIEEIEGVEEVFVFPGMADGGLGHGAAVGWDWDCGENETVPGLDHVYWGPEPTGEECARSIRDSGLEATQPEDLVGETARLLAEGKVVAVCRGALEFGPRALGHRSILYQPTDPSVNDWLNVQLRRTEFMPFAPVTRMENASRCYPKLSSKSTARFMTITTDCSQEMAKKCPAVTHVDGTARPQLIDRETDPFYYDVLKRYEEATGNPSLINTSFNLHEEPIVATPSEAIQAAKQASLNYLILADTLIRIVD
ncbi:MAG: hypothetical protein KC964_17575 [Candidatus Omnitrophica bacterium]|nr:hypothetical protein [Candidatus Omnitrophota bacterium]